MHFDTSRPFFRPRRAQRVALAAMSVGALAFVSACSTASSDEAADSDTLNIVASTSIWGDVAQAVADSADGVDIEVTSLVEGNNMDPHHFEPSAADMARAHEADVVVVGGGGYDAWLYSALDDQDKIIHSLPLTTHDHDHGDEHDDEAHEHEAHEHVAHEHDHGEEGHSHEVESIDGNEHIWYDPTAVMEVAHEIAEHINDVAPAANASDEEVVNQVSGLDSRLHELGKKNYVQSEPIADYLLAHTEMEDLTPEGYRHASLSHGEPAAADLAALIDELKSGNVDVLIYNPQTQTDMTTRIRTTAEDEGIDVVEIGETPPDHQNFFEYFDEVVSSLEALDA